MNSAVSGVSIFILGLDAIWKSRKDSVEICFEMYFPLLSVRSVADFFLQKLIDCLLKYKRQIETRYKYSRVILLECPPVSIIRHNKDKGHKHPEIFHNQNEKLEKQLKLCSSV
jgi:hypothetical protein